MHETVKELKKQSHQAIKSAGMARASEEKAGETMKQMPDST